MQIQKEADKTVFVANLGSSANEEIIFELFLQAGPLKKVTIARDREGRQRSYGFVYYKHAEAVPYAIALLNGTWLFGRQIRLQYGTGSSHQDGGSGPQGTEDDRDDPSHDTPSMNVGLPESSVFHFTGRADGSVSCQDKLHWSNMVRGYPSEQYPLSITPPQPHYYVPPVTLVSPYCPPAALANARISPMGPYTTPPVPARVRPSCSPCLPALPSPASRQLTKVKGLRGRQLSKEKWRLRSYANTDEVGRADCRGTGTDAKSEHIHSNKQLALVIKFKRVAYANY
uniref:RNA binding motif protein 11 n=1 Tax=Oncorhynchus gorbuscha TaxID=8017 RepID=UPI001EAF8816|nr:RNA binding motif protein 11 [Oncorhynchus gorbuscha]